MVITNEKELGTALKENRSVIELKGRIKDIYFEIKAVGPVAWVVAIGGIGVTVAGIIATGGTGGAAAPVAVPLSLVAGGVPASILGVGVTTAAISIAVAAGGVTNLSKLRDYKIIEQTADTIVLSKY
nr:hypothetical protein [uncultured Cellulosilyticum sp.]